MAATPKDYQKLKEENNVRKNKKFPPARTSKTISIPKGSASSRHPEILTNLSNAVRGYWQNSQFRTDEEYAKVTVNDSINNTAEFANFMNYLSTPEDVQPFKTADAYGSWSIIPDPAPSTSPQQLSALGTPTKQPDTPPQPKPTTTGGIFSDIPIRGGQSQSDTTVAPPQPPAPTIPYPLITNPIDIGNIPPIEINPIFPNINTTGISGMGNYSGGSGGSGQKIICNELYRQGFLSQKLWDADERYGDMMFESNPRLVIGYQMWARRVVRYMRNNPNNTKLAYLLFKPWTEYMGYKMGIIKKPSIVGRLTNWIGTHFSYIVFDLYGGNSLLKKYNKVKGGISV